MSTATINEVKPYALRDGLAIYRLGDGDPIFLMPGPHGIGITMPYAAIKELLEESE